MKPETQPRYTCQLQVRVSITLYVFLLVYEWGTHSLNFHFITHVPMNEKLTRRSYFPMCAMTCFLLLLVLLHPGVQTFIYASSIFTATQREHYWSILRGLQHVSDDIK